VAPSDRLTQLELLLNPYFPSSEVTQTLAAPAAVLRAGRSDWRLAAKVVTYRTVEWNIILLPHTKVQEGMPYSRPCCRRDRKFLPLTWSGYFVPAIW